MKNIGRIFQRDIRRICKNALALSVAIGIVLLPALYAWINIAASWDPYGNTGNLKVAVASDDVGYTVVDIDLNIGDKIVDKLRSNDQIGWQFVDRETAIDGVKTGKYYAAIVIPSDFSEKMASFLSDDVKQPKIIYYLNEQTNAIAPKITDSGVSSVQRQINETFSEEATKVVVTALNRISDRLDTGDASLGDRIIDRLRDGQTALERVSLAIDVFLGATDTFGELTATTQAMLPDAQQTTDQLQQTTDQLGELLQITRASADRVADSADRILDAAVDGLDDAAKEVLSLLDDLDSVTNASSVNHLIDKMQRLADRLAKANTTVGQIRTLIERLPLQPEHLIKALHALENKFESAEFFETNREILIYQPDRILHYKVFSVYNNSDEHLMYAFDFSTEEGMQAFLEQCEKPRDMNAKVDTDQEVSVSDKLLVLSTCTNVDTERLLVVAVLDKVEE